MNRLRASAQDDEGIGMLLVIGTMSVLMTLVLVGGSVANRSLRNGQQQDAFTSAMGAAEAGINTGLARVQGAYDFNGSDYQTPHNGGTAYDATPDCSASVVTFPASAGVSNAAETSWAKSKLIELANTPGCLRTGGGGQYVVLKPAGRQAVYAMGWAPSFGNSAQRSRVVKAEYIFSPYKPGNAVLTGGDLELDSSTTITGAIPGMTNANVHSNGDVTVGGGNPRVDGTVSQSGPGGLPSSNKFSGGSERSAVQTIPTVSARNVYGRNVANYIGAWFDLCGDGTARYGAVTGPCTGTLIGNYGPTGALAGNTFRNGWKYDAVGPTWRVVGGFLDGVYYASQANVAMGTGVGNPAVGRATIIASSIGGITCAKSAGNIDWDHVNISAPYVDNLFMLADQDLRTSSNFAAGSASGGTVVSGLFIAGDQVELQTSSNGAYGAVIAGDACDPSGTMVDSNIVKNPTVYFDPDGYAPFTDIVNTTLWLEMVGS